MAKKTQKTKNNKSTSSERHFGVILENVNSKLDSTLFHMTFNDLKSSKREFVLLEKRAMALERARK